MDKEQWAVLIAFFLGCILTNFWGRDLLATYGILNDYFLSQYSYYPRDSNRLLCHILFERGKAAFAIFLLGRVMQGKVFSLLMKSVASALLGFLLTASVISLGIRGIPICMCGLFPQWVFYVAVLFYYANCRKDAEIVWEGGRYAGNTYRHLVRSILLFLGMMLGIVTECYVNPILLTYILKIL